MNLSAITKLKLFYLSIFCFFGLIAVVFVSIVNPPVVPFLIVGEGLMIPTMYIFLSKKINRGLQDSNIKDVAEIKNFKIVFRSAKPESSAEK